MDTQDIILASFRGGHLLALASLFGTLVSLALVAPAPGEIVPEVGDPEAGQPTLGNAPVGNQQVGNQPVGNQQVANQQVGNQRAGKTAAARLRLVRLAELSAVLALLIGLGWLLLQSATIAGTTTITGTLAALITVARGTQFGHLLLLRLLLLLPLVPLLRSGRNRDRAILAANVAFPAAASVGAADLDTAYLDAYSAGTAVPAATSRSAASPAAAHPDAAFPATASVGAANLDAASPSAAFAATQDLPGVAPQWSSDGPDTAQRDTDPTHTHRDPRWWLATATVLAGAALALQGVLGHAGAIEGSVGVVLCLSEALHLLAAGAWLGGLLPLYLLVEALPPRTAAATCHSFTPVGLCAVLLIACTAIVQGWQLIGSLGGLFGTEYGRIALLKLGLFLVLLVLAGLNRFVLTEQLHQNVRPLTLRLLRTSLAIETLLGVLVVLVAALLASGTPATHETPIWPFPRQPSLELLSDPYGRVLLLHAALPSLIAGALVVVGRFWRPIFWPALAALAVTLVFVGPDLLSLLTAEAFPTTFVTSPTEFADSSIMHGKAVFAANCASCHGVEARGDGPAAKSLTDPPADLTAAHFWGHTEGDLFWYISHGIAAPSGAPAMPAFGPQLSSGDIWAVIDFLKANNAGFSMRSTGRWGQPIPLPQFDAVCADGSAIDLDDLRGRVVHVVAAASDSLSPPPVPPGVALTTIVLARDRKVKPVGGACLTVEQTTWDAFAVLLGVPPEALAGTQALADQNGWLRARWRPGDAGDWNDPPVLAALIRDFAAHPIAAAGGGHAHHH